MHTDGHLLCTQLAMGTLPACNTYSTLVRIRIKRTLIDSKPLPTHPNVGILKWCNYWRGVSNSEPEEERGSLFVDIAAKSTAPFPVSSVNDTLRRSQEYVVKNTFNNTRSPVSENATRKSSSLPSSSNASASAEAPKKRPRPSGEVQVVLRFGTDLGGVLSKFQNDVAMSCVLCNQSRKTRLNDYDISKVQLKLNNQSCDFFTDFKFI